MKKAAAKQSGLLRANDKPGRSIERWALAVLLDAHAITECDSHGFMRDRSDPDAWRHARELAAAHPFKGSTAKTSVAAIDAVMGAIGDTCPGCDSER